MFSFNYPSGEPQTPTRTPSSASAVLGEPDFQTPKLESSFFDPRVTWDTSDPYASSPEFLRTPQRLSWAPSARNPADDPPDLKTARRSRQTDPVKRFRSLRGNGTMGEDGPHTVQSARSAASMQTPPPSSASRSKVSEFESINDSQKISLASHAPGNHLETPSRLMGASPRLLANLQSSPDLFQLASIDPSGSPILPQQKLFCDQDPYQQESDVGAPDPNMDPFDSRAADRFNANSHPMQDSHFPQLPAAEGPMDLPRFNSNRFGFPSTNDAALFPAPFSTSPRVSMPKAEDPAMFLSSPARRFGGPPLTPEKRSGPRPARQPYHHQTEESKREELHRAQTSGRFPGSYLDEEEEDDDYTPRQRPGLTRSLTHTAVTRPSHRPGSSPAGLVASTSKIRKSPSKGRSSPVKTLRPQLPRTNSSAPGLPTRSQSVVLKIGKDGRAKTEMQTVPESPTGLTDRVAGMEFEGSTTGSEHDSAEYSEYPSFPNHNSSFALSDAGRPVVDRGGSVSRPHSNGSHASTVASSHSGRLSPWAVSSRGGSGRSQHRPSPERWRTPKRRPVLSNANFTYPSVSAASEDLPEPDEDTGDAQHALRQVLRQRNKRAKPYGLGYGSQPRQPAPSFPHFRSSPPRLDPYPREANTSPTTVTDPDLATPTPTTDRYSNPSNGTRCICNSMDNGGHLMIQWYVDCMRSVGLVTDSTSESCNHWLHTRCVGLERSSLPSVYLCVFCAQTPKRNRGHWPVEGHVPTSPLAHKSYRFR
jgi:hypothetical protein